MVDINFKIDLSQITLPSLAGTELRSFIDQRLFILGTLLVNEIQDKAKNMGLYKTGAFIRGIHHWVENGRLFIQDNVEYGKYLEFGTYAHFVSPKYKKALRWKEKTRERFSKGHKVKGIQPYAPFRKVLYNTNTLNRLTREAFAVPLKGKAAKAVPRRIRRKPRRLRRIRLPRLFRI